MLSQLLESARASCLLIMNMLAHEINYWSKGSMQKSTTVLEVEFLDLLCKVKMQGNGYTFGTKSEVVAGHDFRDYGCYFIQADSM